MTARCAIIGSGHIASDLLLKARRSPLLDVVAMVGIDPESAGLRRARELGVDTSHDGFDWVRRHAGDVDLVFEATSAHAHAEHAPLLAELGVQAVDLTPAAVGPGVVPTVNLDAHLDTPNLNMVTCGGQATVPIVAAVAQVCAVPYAEIVSTIASRSAGPGTRENIDEFTRTTARALGGIGGATQAKAIIVLNPAEPPIVMRNTVYCALPDDAPRDIVTQSVLAMVARVAEYVPGYRLKAEPVFDAGPFTTPSGAAAQRVTVLLEVEGAGDWLPPYAGNMDIMTAAAVRVGEALAQRRESPVAPA